MPYKGKSTTRGWATLPPDIIRLILTHFVLDFSASAFLPQTWAQRDHWLGRLVYNVVRDTEAIEKVMSVCPTWGIASAYNILLSSYVLLLYITLLSSFSRASVVSIASHFLVNLLSSVADGRICVWSTSLSSCAFPDVAFEREHMRYVKALSLYELKHDGV